MSEYKFSRVYVEITNVCNRNCSFCPGTKRDKKLMSLEEFKLILRNQIDICPSVAYSKVKNYLIS